MRTPTFKDLVAGDIKSVFLNPLEFASAHTVNGRRVDVVFDDIEHVEREKRMKSTMDGIYTRQYFLYIAACDFGRLPAQGALVTVDGKGYLVMDATDEAGVYGLTLEAARSV